MEIILFIFLLLLGACIGSFLNVVVWRLPRGESIVFPGSHCPSCGRAIRWYDNLPMLSWLLLGGRCRFCKVRISPRYLVVETVTAGLFVGLYSCYYLLHIRDHIQPLIESWPMLGAHLALLSGLLVCSLVDIEHWIVPLEVCWFVSLVGLAAAAAAPPPAEILPPVSAATAAVSLGAMLGLLIAIVLQHYGLIQPSFLDAQERVVTEPKNEPAKTRGGKKRKKKGHKAEPERRITAVAITKEHGVNPRLEVMRELLFLAPAMLLAAAAGLLVTRVGAIRSFWVDLVAPARPGLLAHHLGGLFGAIYGYLIGGLWIWGMRIFGTLAFGKEAMGMGDVHILAAVGAVTGWIVPTLAFFIAPFFGLLWALYLWLGRRQRELPYGPWLAAGTLVVMLFYDAIYDFVHPLFQVLGQP